ncbi:hypothetical protein KM043_004819 [Ampulex compressa]|nr:hypothetical protein KM043_004819 [Ampulex compressa]
MLDRSHREAFIASGPPLPRGRLFKKSSRGKTEESPNLRGSSLTAKLSLVNTLSARLRNDNSLSWLTTVGVNRKVFEVFVSSSEMRKTEERGGGREEVVFSAIASLVGVSILYGGSACPS